MCVEAPASPAGWVDVDDALLAARHDVPVLITASSDDAVVETACRVHAARHAAPGPLVTFRASGFFNEPLPFAAQWAGLLDAGRGGTILLTAIDELAPGAQVLFKDALGHLRAGRPALAPRIMAGTTVPLLDRVMSGEFSEELFYQLNVIHLFATEARPD